VIDEVDPWRTARLMAEQIGLYAEANASPEVHWLIEPLHEKDFDFSMTRLGEERYLELQEIAIPPKKRGLPYRDREQVVNSSKFADTIASEMQRRPLDLLLYVTHWRFQTNAMVLRLLGHHFKRSAHPFAHVYVFTMLDDREGRFEQIFPNDETLEVAGRI